MCRRAVLVTLITWVTYIKKLAARRVKGAQSEMMMAMAFLQRMPYAQFPNGIGIEAGDNSRR